MQRRLGLYLAVFASGVLLFSALQQSEASVLTLRQAYVNLGVAVVATLVLVWPFPELVQVFCGILRFTAPVTGILFLARGQWAYVPPLLLLGLVFQGCMWVAQEIREGRGLSGMWRDMRYGLSRLRGVSGDDGDAEAEADASPHGTEPRGTGRRKRRAGGPPVPFDPDVSDSPSGGSFIVRGPEEPAPDPPPDAADPRDPTNPTG